MKDLKAIIAATLIMNQMGLGVTQQILGKDGNTVSQSVKVSHHPNHQHNFSALRSFQIIQGLQSRLGKSVKLLLSAASSH